jgi:hypothetical protein
LFAATVGRWCWFQLQGELGAEKDVEERRQWPKWKGEIYLKLTADHRIAYIYLLQILKKHIFYILFIEWKRYLRG